MIAFHRVGLALLLAACPVRAWEPARDAFGDPLPEGALARLGSTRLRVVDATCLALSPDGRFVAAGDYDGTVHVWLTHVGDLGLRFEIGGSVETVAFSVDSARVAAVSDAGTVAEYALVDNRLIRRTELAGAGGSGVMLSPDLSCVALNLNIASQGLNEGAEGTLRSMSRIRIMRLDDGKMLWERIEQDTRGRTFHSFSPDGKRLFWGGCILDAATGRTIVELGSGRFLQWCTDGRHCFAAGGPNAKENEVRRFDTATGKSLETLAEAKAEPLALSPDGRTLVTYSSGRVENVQVQDPSRQEHISIHRFGADPKSHTLLINVGAWGANRRPPMHAVSNDGGVVATLGEERFVQLWNADTGKLICPPHGPGEVPWRLAFSPDGLRIAAVETEVIIFDARNGRQLQRLPAPVPHAQHDPEPSFRPDGSFVWLPGVPYGESRSADGRIRARFKEPGVLGVCDETGKELSVVALPGEDRRQLHRFRRNETISIDTNGAAKVQDFILAVSPDGKSVATAGIRAKLREIPSGRLRAQTGTHDSVIKAMTFSPDGSLLATGSLDRTIKIWSAADGKLLRTFVGHEGAVASLAFSPDGKRLGSGSHDTTVLVWDLAMPTQGGR